MATYESRNERDQRVVKIWEALDTRREGQIDFNGLKKGLKKIDHREHSPCSDRVPMPQSADYVPALKNADGMLREVLQAVDTNGDGRIDYAGKIACRFFRFLFLSMYSFARLAFMPVFRPT